MKLQYNKLYQSLKKVYGEWHAGHVEWGYHWYYLKFYEEDNTFIYSLIDGDNPDKINRWFNKSTQGVTHGTFKKDNQHLYLMFNSNNIEVKAFINKDNSIIVEGKLNWDIYLPLP